MSSPTSLFLSTFPISIYRPTDPAEWMPPSASYHCTYIRAWVTVKSYYKLTVDTAEKAAITK